MPKAYSPFTISKFKGQNSAILGAGIDDSEFTYLQNFNPTREGLLRKRTGLINVVSTVYGGTNQRVLGIQRTAAGTDYLIFTDGAKVWRSALPGLSSATEVLLAAASIANVSWGFESGYNIPTNQNQFNLVRNPGAPIGISEAGVAATLGAGGVATFALAFKERMWLFDSRYANGSESQIFYSKVGDYSTWAAPDGGVMNVQVGDGDFLVSAIIYNDQLIMFKSRSTWVLSAEGDRLSWTVRQLHGSIGCAGRGTPVIINGFIYFFSGTSVYRTDGTTFEDLGLNIKDKFNFAWDTPALTMGSDATFWDNKYILRLNNSSNTLYVYDIYADAWTTWVLHGAAACQGFARYQEYSTDFLYTGNPVNGKLMRFGDTFYEDDSVGTSTGTGTQVQAQAFTKHMDFGNPASYKRNHYSELVYGGSAGADTVRVDYVKDSLTTVANSNKTVLAGTQANIHRFPGAGRFRTLQAKLYNQGTSGCTIYSLLEMNEVKEIVPMNR